METQERAKAPAGSWDYPLSNSEKVRRCFVCYDHEAAFMRLELRRLETEAIAWRWRAEAAEARLQAEVHVQAAPAQQLIPGLSELVEWETVLAESESQSLPSVLAPRQQRLSSSSELYDLHMPSPPVVEERAGAPSVPLQRRPRLSELYDSHVPRVLDDVALIDLGPALAVDIEPLRLRGLSDVHDTHAPPVEDMFRVSSPVSAHGFARDPSVRNIAGRLSVMYDSHELQWELDFEAAGTSEAADDAKAAADAASADTQQTTSQKVACFEESKSKAAPLLEAISRFGLPMAKMSPRPGGALAAPSPHGCLAGMAGLRIASRRRAVAAASPGRSIECIRAD